MESHKHSATSSNGLHEKPILPVAADDDSTNERTRKLPGILWHFEGYKGVILVASFLSYLVTIGAGFTVGVYFVSFLEEFEGERALLSTISSLVTGIILVTGEYYQPKTNDTRAGILECSFSLKVTLMPIVLMLGQLFAILGTTCISMKRPAFPLYPSKGRHEF